MLKRRAGVQTRAAALRLINDQVPAALLAHSQRGETVARVDLDPVPLKPAAGRLGRINDHVLCEALEDSGPRMLALSCKKLMALGFALIDVAASRGVMSARVGWRDLSKAEPNPSHFDRTARQLRQRGFQVELVEAGTALRVTW